MLLGHIILQFFQSCSQQSKYIELQLAVNFQNMLASTRSFKEFKRVIASSTSHLILERPADVISGGELCIESRVDDHETCLLGLQSEKSKLEDKVVKSSIDSDKKKQSVNSSIPLSELILTDNGYDYLFNAEGDPKKLQRKYLQNLKQIKSQTQQIIDLVHLHLIAIESQEIKEKIVTLEKQISRIRANRKSKSPIQQYSDYLCYVGKRKQRRSGKLIAAQLRQSRSNVRTQCDSKGPSLPSAPATPTSHCKMMLSPKRQHLGQYFLILKTKKQTIQASIQTISNYYTRRIDLYKQQNNACSKEIMLLDSKNISTPFRSNPLRGPRGTVGPIDSSSKSHHKTHRRLLGFHSPRENREPRKSQTPRLLSRARREFMVNARQQYFISN